jgi:hypothetical protein
MEMQERRLHKIQRGFADGLCRLQQLAAFESLRPEPFVDVIVEGAHHRVGQPIRGVGEDADDLHNGVAGHPQPQRVGDNAQRGTVGLGTGSDVIPVEDLGQVADHSVVETEFSGSIHELYRGVPGLSEFPEDTEKVAVACGGAR